MTYPLQHVIAGHPALMQESPTGLQLVLGVIVPDCYDKGPLEARAITLAQAVRLWIYDALVVRGVLGRDTVMMLFNTFTEPLRIACDKCAAQLGTDKPIHQLLTLSDRQFALLPGAQRWVQLNDAEELSDGIPPTTEGITYDFWPIAYRGHQTLLRRQAHEQQRTAAQRGGDGDGTSDTSV